jgi:hypothetical protein
MSLSPSRCARGAGLLLLLGLALPTVAQGSLATLTYVENDVEADGAKGWQEATEGGAFDIGQQLRTGPSGMARLQLPWMALSVSPDSAVRLPDEFVLSIALDKGRVVVDSESQDALKLVTPEAEIRGQGRTVVRREPGRTLVTCVSGRFLVEARGRGVSLETGQGTVVAADRAPTAAENAPSPPSAEGLWPGADPVYAERGQPLDLYWEGGDSPAFQIEILPVGHDFVLYQRDVGPPPVQVSVPWGGAFRWRVASRDDRGLEGIPSQEGLICVELE